MKREPEDLTRRSSSPNDSFVLGKRVYLSPPSDLAISVGSSSTTGLDRQTKAELEAQIKEEGGDTPRRNTTYLMTQISSDPQNEDEKMTTQYVHPNYPNVSSAYSYDSPSLYVSPSPQPYTPGAPSHTSLRTTPGGSFAAPDHTYVDTYQRAPSVPATDAGYTLSRTEYAAPTSDYDRYTRLGTHYPRTNISLAPADSSPDSGTSSDPGREQLMFNSQVRGILFVC